MKINFKNRVLAGTVAGMILAAATFSTAMAGSSSISFSFDDKKVNTYTSSVTGSVGKATVKNNSSSKGTAGYHLQKSTGSGWSSVSTGTAQPGATSTSGKISGSSSATLWRTHVYSNTTWLPKLMTGTASVYSY